MPNDLLIGNVIPASMRSATAQKPVNETLIVARVVKVDLESVDNLATIEFESINTATVISGKAKPIWNNLRTVPYPDEIVLIVRGPSKDINDIKTSTEYYYYPPYSLWSTSHHNKFPSPNILQLENEQGVVKDREICNRIVYTLQPFAGDVIQEGRWGNSIRFSSTGPNQTSTPWSNTGVNGDPITIITNGHQTAGLENWSTITENIDVDQASIWMTSTQEVKIKDIIDNFTLESFYGESAIYGTHASTSKQSPNRTISPNQQDDTINA